MKTQTAKTIKVRVRNQKVKKAKILSRNWPQATKKKKTVKTTRRTRLIQKINLK